MIFLELHNRSVEEFLLVKFENAKQGGKLEKFDQVVTDFDGVLYRLHSLPTDKSKIVVSIFLIYSDTLLTDDVAKEFLRNEYGSHICATPEPEASVSLLYDLVGLPEKYASLARQAGLLRRNCFAAVMDRFFRFHFSEEEGVTESLVGVIPYRPNETIFIQATSDRLTVIFSTRFNDREDVILGKVFLQEFTEVRRRIDRAPQVLYSYGACPAELRGSAAATGDNMAHITFVLFPRHLQPTTTLPRSTDLMISLRNYLHYHIKCSRGYIHRRMRAKTSEFIKILNRAHPQHTITPIITHNGGTPVRLLPQSSLPSSNAKLSTANGDNSGNDDEVIENGQDNSTLVNGYF